MTSETEFICLKYVSYYIYNYTKSINIYNAETIKKKWKVFQENINSIYIHAYMHTYVSTFIILVENHNLNHSNQWSTLLYFYMQSLSWMQDNIAQCSLCNWCVLKSII